jgi:plasmid stability protein
MREEGKKEVWITGPSHTKLKVRAAQNKKTISDEVEEILKQFFQMEESKSSVIV